MVDGRYLSFIIYQLGCELGFLKELSKSTKKKKKKWKKLSVDDDDAWKHFQAFFV